MARRRRRKFRVGSPMPKNSRISAAGAEHSGSRCLYARAGYTVAVAVFVRIVHRAGATAEYNNGSDELLHGTTSSEGPARSTAELAVVGVVVGTKAHLSAIHHRSSRLSKLVTPSMRTSRRSWTRETSPPLSSRGTVHAGRPRTLPSTLAFISPTAGRECSRHQ